MLLIVVFMPIGYESFERSRRRSGMLLIFVTNTTGLQRIRLSAQSIYVKWRKLVSQIQEDLFTGSCVAAAATEDCHKLRLSRSYVNAQRMCHFIFR